MAKVKTFFTCQQCGFQSPKWLGKCPDCNQWNTLVEEQSQPLPGSRALPTPGKPQKMCEITNSAEDRVSCGLAELDRTLGGGLVAGSLILIGGDPGIGKSTLLLQTANQLGKRGKALYVTAEESPRQVKMRGDRLGAASDNLYLLAETSLEQIRKRVSELKPDFLIIDSIQTIFTSSVESAPGSVSQVRECAGQLMMLAKGEGIPTFLVGHVTKDGSIAGPRVLEHMVDTVLYFEGDPGHPYRILRAVKNRFGSTNEIGVFEMQENGLREVSNPSELFLAERPEKTPGSVVVPALEGTRPILVELQALVSGSSFGTPQRTAIGIDHKRMALLIAILDKKVELQLAGQDIFVNVAGGVRVDEPAIDLATIAALASSHLNRAIEAQTVIFGEVGLTGEVRAVSQPELRVKEAARLGFNRCILPQGCLKNLKPPRGMKLIPIRHASELIDLIFN
ncbi:DNA repair protein RadA [Geopsychrobacter electrodiphilus]|uniref:DNA repair protein RadA n=1 Tax=Geopsychrobacter electrodiphilus TaxID=225196 RepID=UPI00037DDA7D|nr:DNA repair protein RadA [Geopsychrobacter electrodiphilus]